MFVCEENQSNIIRSMMRSEFNIDIEESVSRRRYRSSKPAGPGFGDKVWRVNYETNRVEASFARPCHQSRSLKAAGFMWDNGSGVWYRDNTGESASVCMLIKLVQVDPVDKK